MEFARPDLGLAVERRTGCAASGGHGAHSDFQARESPAVDLLAAAGGLRSGIRGNLLPDFRHHPAGACAQCGPVAQRHSLRRIEQRRAQFRPGAARTGGLPDYAGAGEFMPDADAGPAFSGKSGLERQPSGDAARRHCGLSADAGGHPGRPTLHPDAVVHPEQR
ncbi:hypothetical protein SDC9_147769 [bioreactor metagenome]|uniref:Uncharacterized protein n=1 Tax=bioreactor metagenome TaxID=1076179 RepID=A0A645EJ16_9ZZZZ